ncbi:MAG: hypothetical protein KC451_01015, partial [Amylibacter sp.]|nr:hypothetical protein [Amylibacter sp.]
MKHLLILAISISAIPLLALAKPIDKANALFEHGLTSQSKAAYIDIIFEVETPEAEIAEALFRLGSIAFSENRVDLALREWGKLLARFPVQAAQYDIEKKIARIGDVYGSTADQILDNAVAKSFIANGDFYSDEKSLRTTIDTIWIPVIEASIAWYDRVITEFPKSPEAKTAYLKKFATIKGWKAKSKYGEDFGLFNKSQVTNTLSQLEKMLEQFEVDFPKDPSLQRMRYTIAQGYWMNKKWDDTRKWLNLIVSSDDERNGFYKDLAEWRL